MKCSQWTSSSRACPRLTGRALRVAVLAVAAAGTVACSDITKVTNNQTIQPSSFDNPTGALIRRAGAYRDFVNAFGFQVAYTGLLTDELSDSRGTSAVADQRRITTANQQQGLTFPYPALSTARLELQRAIVSLQQYYPAPRSNISELYSLEGYVELFFAEDMCSGVPLANEINGTPVEGSTLTRSQLVQAALAHFDSATMNAFDSLGNADTTTSWLAAVGTGRALLDSGNAGAAATAVAAIPTRFAYAAQYDGNVQVNELASLFVASVSVSNQEGQNGLPFVSAADPRVPIDSNTAIQIDGHPFYLFRSMESRSAPITLASGIEASLIRAEARLVIGDVSGWADTLNALRQTAISPSMPPLSASATSATADTLTMYGERAYWLFLSGHRQGDLRRLVRTTGRSQASVFPIGPYPGVSGVTYGNDVTFIPYLEAGNPNFTGCFDRLP